MSRSDQPSASSSLWRRWTSDEGPFYRSCAVFPFDAPTDETAADPEGSGKPAVEFSTGITRLLLRNVPTFLIAVLLVYVPANVLYWLRTGALTVPFSVSADALVVAVPASLVGAVWLYVAYRVATRTVDTGSFHRQLVFFLAAIPLVAGTAYAVYHAWANAGSGADPALTVQAGYFLFVLLAGHLVYDGLALRTEHLFANLATSSIVDAERYAAFYDDLAGTLGKTVSLGPVTVPQSVAFALVLALGPILLPVFVTPWQGLLELAYVAYSIVTLFVVAILLDVFLLVYKFTELLRSDVLSYQPFHPDEHGGFRDLGRFATRVNVVLALAGGYVAYRFAAEGLLNLPAGDAGYVLFLTWGILYVGPIVAYVILVVFWLYHSFWRLHRKMQRGRQERMEALQRRQREEMGDTERDVNQLETDAPAWEIIQTAPTWPIKRQSLFGILVIDAVPVVVTFLV